MDGRKEKKEKKGKKGEKREKKTKKREEEEDVAGESKATVAEISDSFHFSIAHSPVIPTINKSPISSSRGEELMKAMLEIATTPRTSPRITPGPSTPKLGKKPILTRKPSLGKKPSIGRRPSTGASPGGWNSGQAPKSPRSSPRLSPRSPFRRFKSSTKTAGSLSPSQAAGGRPPPRSVTPGPSRTGSRTGSPSHTRSRSPSRTGSPTHAQSPPSSPSPSASPSASPSPSSQFAALPAPSLSPSVVPRLSLNTMDSPVSKTHEKSSPPYSLSLSLTPSCRFEGERGGERGERGEVLFLLFVPLSNTLWVAFENGQISIFEVDTLKELQTLILSEKERGEKEVGEEKEEEKEEEEEGEEEGRRKEKRRKWIGGLVFDRGIVGLVCEMGRVILWEGEKGEKGSFSVVGSYCLPQKEVRSVVIVAGKLFTGDRSGVVMVWDFKSMTLLSRVTLPSPIECCCLEELEEKKAKREEEGEDERREEERDEKRREGEREIIWWGSLGVVFVVEGQKVISLETTPNVGVNDIVSLQKKKEMWSCGEDGTIHIWDTVLQTKKLFHQEFSYPLYSLQVAKDNGLVFVAGSHPSIAIFSTSLMKTVSFLESHKKEVNCVYYINDKKSLLSGGKQSLLCVWKQGKEEKREGKEEEKEEGEEKEEKKEKEEKEEKEGKEGKEKKKKRHKSGEKSLSSIKTTTTIKEKKKKKDQKREERAKKTSSVIQSVRGSHISSSSPKEEGRKRTFSSLQCSGSLGDLSSSSGSSFVLLDHPEQDSRRQDILQLDKTDEFSKTLKLQKETNFFKQEENSTPLSLCVCLDQLWVYFENDQICVFDFSLNFLCSIERKKDEKTGGNICAMIGEEEKKRVILVGEDGQIECWSCDSKDCSFSTSILESSLLRLTTGKLDANRFWCGATDGNIRILDSEDNFRPIQEISLPEIVRGNEKEEEKEDEGEKGKKKKSKEKKNRVKQDNSCSDTSLSQSSSLRTVPLSFSVFREVMWVGSFSFIFQFDRSNFQFLRSFQAHPACEVLRICPVPPLHRVWSASKNGNLSRWSVRKHPWRHSKNIHFPPSLPNPKSISDIITLWKEEDGRAGSSSSSKKKKKLMSDAEVFVVSGGLSGDLVLWDAWEEVCVALKKEAHVGSVCALGYLGKSQFVSCGKDGFLRVWRIR